MEVLRCVLLLWCLSGLVVDVACNPTFVSPNPSDTITVPENEALGTPIYDVSVTDTSGTNTAFTFNIAADQGAPGLFTITQKAAYEEAVVTVTGNIDYETFTTFTLTITATAGSGKIVQPIIYVNVQDVNEAPTLNLNSVVTLAENSAVGTSVFDVICSDVDTTSPNGDTVLTHTDTGSSGFFDVASTGEVTLSSSTALDYETKQLHTITFTCTDGGTLSATGTLDVQVTNVNEPPVISNPSTGSEIMSIDENASPNTNVYLFAASDEDSGDTLTWTIDSQTPNTQFVLDGATGQVSTATSPVLDYETNNQYILVVHVVDSASLTASASLTVNLNDLNEAPTFTVFPASDTLNVDENESGSAALFIYTASDEEISTQTLTFSMDTNPPGGTVPFEFVKTGTTTAELQTAAAPNIDFETVNQYDLTLTVTDDGSGNLSEDRSLTIYVQDLNEAPVITNTASSLTMTLDENQAANAAVFTFTGNDEDQPGDTLTWKITNQSPSNQFAINSATGAVTTSTAPVINFESAETQYVLDVTLDDGTGVGTFTATATLTINVQDVNEAPTLTNLNSVVTIAENSAVGTSVFDVICSDVDTTSPNGDTVLTHTDTGSSGFFDVASTGEVTLSSSTALDYETKQLHTITFTCTDGGTLSATGTLDVQVTNVNEPPVISNPSTGSEIMSIDENASPNTNVYLFAASDEDSGDTLTWTIDSQTPNTQFVLDGATGQVSTATSPVLDYETNNQYILVVHVVDSASLTASASLTVNLNDLNEAPTFTVFPASDTLNVDENESGSAALFIYTASDEEISTQTLTFSMDTNPPGGTVPFEFVKTGTTTAELRTAAAPNIDFETVNQYDLTLTVTDDGSGNLSEDRSLTIYVQDLNEAPVITNTASSLTMTLDENQAANAAVFTFTGNDEDQPGDTLTWKITNQSPSNQFDINAATGVVSTTTAPVINFESAETQYVLDVTLDDGTGAGTFTATATLTINVQDVNETPDFTSFPGSASVDVNENTTGSVTVQSFTVYDDDNALVSTTQDITYTIALVSPVGATLPFTFDKVDNTNVDLNTDSTAAIDYETMWSTYSTNQYQVNLTVSDGTLSTVRTFYINIIDVNEVPVITNLASSLSITIDEDEAGGKNLIFFTGTDEDLPGDTLTWSIASQTPSALGTNFEIGPSTGTLSIVSSPTLDYEQETQYLLQVELSDGTGAGRLTATSTYTVNIRDINEAPSFSDTSLTYEIDENSAGGVTVCPTSNTACTTTLQGTDPDGDTLTYSLISFSPVEDGYSNPFQLTPSGNDLIIETVASPDLDYERATAYTLKIRVKDGSTSGSKSSTGEITINLVDLDESPEWRNLPNSITVSEDMAGNQKGVAVTYNLISPPAAFQLVAGTGEIRTTATPNLESGAFLYTLEIVAADATTNTATSTLTVNVAFYDDSPPVFSPTTYTVNVNEGESSGTTVTTIPATDADLGDVVQYYITGGNGYFQVDSSGVITTGTELDRDAVGSPASYTLTLTGYDTSGLSAQATVTVNVDAVNDNPPVFSQTYDTSGLSAQTTVTVNVDAVNDNAPIFSQTVTSVMYVSCPYDTSGLSAQATGTVTVNVDAVNDNPPIFSQTATVTVNVDAVNDNAPLFSQTVTSVDVPENTATTTSVLQLTCTDADTGTDGDLVYAIDSGNTDNLFALDTSTGLITVASAIDMEAAAIISANFRYTLKVTAVDQAAVAADRLTSTATIYVTVTGQNEFTPDFTTMPASDTVTLSEDTAVATTVTSGRHGYTVGGYSRGDYGHIWCKTH
ncbi:hypothetical protein Bbelb_107740 [Branchiostoma belcheri]|nr:hypothetical protein Bbelb_107740 [Branchiostoma belcheri]